MTEQNKFLDDLGHDQSQEVDILEESLTPDAEKATDDKVDEEKEGDDVQPKNRRERRLIEKLQAERESSIFLAGKLEARSEAERSITEESDYLKSVERIYGTETPEAQLATDLLKKALTGMRDDAKSSALAELRAERAKELADEKDAQKELDGFIEDIEDTYGVTLTETQERSFFQLLGKMSPKDTDGNVKEYADPHAVWEVFQERIKNRGTDNRAKDLSSRSMVKSGASKDTLQDDSTARFLAENDII